MRQHGTYWLAEEFADLSRCPSTTIRSVAETIGELCLSNDYVVVLDSSYPVHILQYPRMLDRLLLALYNPFHVSWDAGVQLFPFYI